jgi:hypothetical protein
MEEKEMIGRIRNSLKNGHSDAQIMGRLQGKGYKLEYANALLKKAKPRRWWVYFIFVIVFILLVAIASFSYLMFFQQGEKQDLQNPLAGLNINFAVKPGEDIENSTENLTEVYLEDIIVTPEFLSYLLNEIGANEALHKNPLTFEKPIINFKVDEVYFNSIVDNGITTLEGSAEEVDIQFNTKKEELIMAMLSENPEEVFKNSIVEGKTEIQTIAGEAELFTKGYLQLYDNLK